MDISQVIGEKNWEHRIRHITKAIWYEQLTTVTARMEMLNTFKVNLFRDVTAAGYYAAVMNQAGMCDHVAFGTMVTTIIGERAFAAGRAAGPA